MKIKKYKLEKVFTEEVDFRMPTEVLYLFEFGVRRSIKVTPVYTTWNKEIHNKEEEIYKLEFILVLDGFNHNATITKIVIDLTDMERIYTKNDYNDVNLTLLDFINTFDSSNIRTKEQFEVDFNNTLNELL